MKDFSIENQYKTYLERVNMKEESMQSIKTKLFYAIEDPESPESDEPTIHHKWGKWEKKEIPIQLRMLGVTYKQERKCNVCGATQTKTYYKNQAWPELEVMRNFREDVDCNPELKPQSKT